uniref:Nondiscriminating glutamyl-tRNA synthetase EARS2, mitochondrial n=1 Tax=Strigamia maritima TaxID=126957 RepID=T1IN70_STRMM
MKVLNYFNNARYFSQTCPDVRVRFAPSPTGFLHLGGLRTALYNYMFARSTNGTFILRVEDTDQTRVVPEAIDKIQEMLGWMGITIDEGPKEGGKYGPYIQSQRLNMYQNAAKVLVETGAAYRCFCTEKRLDLIRKECAKRNENPRYDNHCRHLTNEELQTKLAQKQQHVIRFKVVLKSDGYPTYHLANIVDDHLMKITHVLRGVVCIEEYLYEWQTSTTKHILLHKALNQEPPNYAHLPLIINKDGKKLSKRQQDIHLESFKNKGYYPQAILNFLIRVGGGCGQLDETLYTINDLIDKFSLKNVRNNSSRLETERLDGINQMHIHTLLEKNVDTKLMVNRVRQLVQNTFSERLGNSELQAKILKDENVERILQWCKPRIYVLQDLVKPDLQFLWLFSDNIKLPSPIRDSKAAIKKVSTILESIDNEQFSPEILNRHLKKLSTDEKIKYGWLMKLLRLVLSNLQEGPQVAEMMAILGKEATLDRLSRCHDLFVDKEYQ